MKELLRLAARYGLTVHGTHLPGDKVGCYVPSERRIYFDLAITQRERIFTIAHELGHAHYGHDCDSRANERQADAYAAGLLVNPEWYAELEAINPDAGWIAEEMGLPRQAIEDYRRYCLQRIANFTYSHPKMGMGQWRYRAASV